MPVLPLQSAARRAWPISPVSPHEPYSSLRMLGYQMAGRGEESPDERKKNAIPPSEFGFRHEMELRLTQPPSSPIKCQNDRLGLAMSQALFRRSSYPSNIWGK
jgi:hypothetical protein